MTDAISVWIHVLAVTVWIGPQFFLFVAAVPALRTVEDAQVRARVMRIIVTRFGWMAWGAMGVIVLSGIGNLFMVGDDAPFSLWSSDYRWGRIFLEKMVFVGVAVALTALHTFFVGPQQLRLAEQAQANPDDVRYYRRMSMLTSGVALLAAIAAVYMGVMLAHHEYSFQER
ncbi:MAG TPA: DUF4149 domain-containing protein [Dehalococcoidia bacterium]|jgi:uncharacterized membrane protein|nr:DUF4149 domain-containing protein [Dehalococcoidia bacterium]